MLAYCLAFIGFGVAVYLEFNTVLTMSEKGRLFIAVLEATTVFIRSAGFSVAHWIFGFKYFKIQRVAPIYEVGREIPADIVDSLGRLNKIFIALNVFAPLLEGIGYYANVMVGD